MLLLLLLKLCLLLLVLLQAFLALVAGQFTVRRALGHALSLRPRARALRCYRVAFDHADVLRVGVASTAHVSWLDLSIDGVLVLTAGVGTDADLAAVVLVVHVELASGRVADHVHMRPARWVVLLAVVGGELILVLEEGVLGALRSARAVRDVAPHMVALSWCSAVFA